MTHKERLTMLTNWVKDINPKAFLHHADARLGGYYAIATRNDGGVHIWTQFMTLTELEKALVLFFDYDNFIKIKEKRQ